MPAEAGPPRFFSKNAVCLGPGLPSEIDQATMRPSRGIVNRLRAGPILTW